MTHHNFTVMAEVKLNTSHQELVLLKDRFFLRGLGGGGVYPVCLFLRAHKCGCTCLRVRYGSSEIEESLCVSVPLDPAEVLHHSLGCFGQALGIRHHLVSRRRIHIHAGDAR